MANNFDQATIISITNIGRDDTGITICNVVTSTGKKLNGIRYSSITDNHLIIKS